MAAGEKIIGIDLGTTNSVVSIMEGSEPKVIANAEGIGEQNNQPGEKVLEDIAEGEADGNAADAQHLNEIAGGEGG